MVDTSDKLKNN